MAFIIGKSRLAVYIFLLMTDLNKKNMKQQEEFLTDKMLLYIIELKKNIFFYIFQYFKIYLHLLNNEQNLLLQSLPYKSTEKLIGSSKKTLFLKLLLYPTNFRFSPSERFLYLSRPYCRFCSFSFSVRFWFFFYVFFSSLFFLNTCW